MEGDDSLEVGDTVFGDKTADRCDVSELPAKHKDAEIIFTPCDTKTLSKAQAELMANQDLTFYIGFVERLTAASE